MGDVAVEDLCHGMDPVGFARERLGIDPDRKQAEVLADDATAFAELYMSVGKIDDHGGEGGASGLF